MDPRTASLGEKSSKRNGKVEISTSLEAQVCEVLLYVKSRNSWWLNFEAIREH